MHVDDRAWPFKFNPFRNQSSPGQLSATQLCHITLFISPGLDLPTVVALTYPTRTATVCSHNSRNFPHTPTTEKNTLLFSME